MKKEIIIKKLVEQGLHRIEAEAQYNKYEREAMEAYEEANCEVI